jgi:2-polyprenyl-6-methoxyphenol hydroxylase-like FAD-dependent oxidoreductase
LVSISTTSQGVTATFSDFTTATGSHLLGADGARSFTRNVLLSPSEAALTALPIMIFNFKARFTAEQAQFLRDTTGHDPVMNFGIFNSPNFNALFLLSMLDLPDVEKPDSWTFSLLFSSMSEDNEKVISMTSQQRLELLKRRASKFVDPWRSALEWLPLDTFVPADVCAYWEKPLPWDNRGYRVTLAGDAAHAVVSSPSEVNYYNSRLWFLLWEEIPTS